MTDYSKITIEEIWAKRELNRINKVNSDLKPGSMGNGIFVQTDSGNTLFDLRSARDRLFLGHNHPLLFRAKQNSKLTKLTTAKELPAEFQKKKVELELSDIIKGNELSSLTEDCVVVEKDLCLFATNDLFYLPPNTVNKRVIYSTLLEVFAWEQECSEPSFEASLLHCTNEVLNSFFHTSATYEGKNAKDTKLLNSLRQEFPDRVKVLQRHILLDSKLSNALHSKGILHSLVESNSVLGYPLACTESEISSSLEIIRSVIKEA